LRCKRFFLGFSFDDGSNRRAFLSPGLLFAERKRWATREKELALLNDCKKNIYGFVSTDLTVLLSKKLTSVKLLTVN